MGYNKETGMMTKGISIKDIQMATHYSRADVGSCISEGYINPWAKFKPVATEGFGEVSEEARKVVNYGMPYIPYYTSLRNLCLDMRYSIIGGTIGERADNYVEGSTPWEHKKPRGGASEPFRMLDFDGYYSKAEQFISRVDVPETTIGSDGLFEATSKIGELTEFTINASDIRAIVNSTHVEGMNYIGIGYSMGPCVTVKATKRISEMEGGKRISLSSRNYPITESGSWPTSLFVVLSKERIEKVYESFGERSEDVSGYFIPVVPSITTENITVYIPYFSVTPWPGWFGIYVGPDEVCAGIEFGIDLVYNADIDYKFTFTAYYKDGSIWAKGYYDSHIYLPEGAIEGTSSMMVYFRNRNDDGEIAPRAYLMYDDDPFELENTITLTEGAINNGEPFMHAKKEAEYILLEVEYGIHESPQKKTESIEIWPSDWLPGRKR